jgi:hypothetical protein
MKRHDVDRKVKAPCTALRRGGHSWADLFKSRQHQQAFLGLAKCSIYDHFE